MGKLK